MNNENIKKSIEGAIEAIDTAVDHFAPRMREVSENDYHAIRLLREKMGLKKKMMDLRLKLVVFLEKSFQGEDQGEVPEDTGSMKDRIEQIDYALEAWANGENVLAAILSDPREGKKAKDVMLNHHSLWMKQQISANLLAVQQQLQTPIQSQIQNLHNSQVQNYVNYTQQYQNAPGGPKKQ